MYVTGVSLGITSFDYATVKIFFTTSPLVTTDNATSITSNSARLNGTLTSMGTASSANVSFQLGTGSGNYSHETTSVSVNATGAFSANISSLSVNTTYYFRAKAVGDGTSYGAEKSFATILPGDATGDGIVDARDITKVERIIA
ncbi:MAG: hypothetical protein HW402_1261, partial [Dehalococcoidales bacterium]|nr:hypothetical protein [Dehalococcoidales bacterium]